MSWSSLCAEMSADMSPTSPLRENRKKSEPLKIRRCVEMTVRAGSVRVLTGYEAVASLPPTVSNSNQPQDTDQLAAWDDLNEMEKGLIIGSTMSNARPFTLNFDNTLMEEAKRYKKPLATYIGNRISDCLKRVQARWGEDFDRWFVIEVAPGGYIHVHGGIEIANDNALPDLREALKKASGTKPSDFQGKEVCIRAFDPQKHFGGFHGADGWVNYCFKERRKTEKRLKKQGHRPGSVAVFGRRLTQRGRDAWNKLRAKKNPVVTAAPKPIKKPCEVWGSW
jgi:hypothetical protein